MPLTDMPERLRGAQAFETALAGRPRGRSPHFALHVVTAPATAAASVAVRNASAAELSTARTGEADPLVDVVAPAPRCRLGMVVPKRHAKRAVTRNLVKRQMRAAVARHAASLPPGDWVLRLRAPLDRKLYTSARSQALAVAVRAELETLFAPPRR
jgi:ribonuclease P protein component